MNRINGSRFERWWVIALVVLIALPAGFVTARQAVFNNGSPATGHAQVITQGISKLPTGEVVWRVVERTAKPRGEAQATKQVLSFVLATEEPVLLTNVSSSGRMDDVARLAPGESYLVKNGARQIRASLSDQEVTYLAIELVPAATADDTGGGKLLFVSAPFTAPTGERDLDLVRNVLIAGESATLPDTGESVAILATEGSIDILPSGGNGKKLDAGEGAIFSAGELEIAAGESVSSSAPVRAQFSAMTNALQQGDGSRAAYVVAVIGPEIPPPPIQSQSTATATVLPTAVVLEQPTEAPTTGGVISVTVTNCPLGMTLQTLETTACEVASEGYEVSLDGPDGGRTLADAVGQDEVWTWSDLPLGTYHLTESSLPLGYDDYFIPGSAAVGGSAADGYTITIDETAPRIGVVIYNFRPAPATGLISVMVLICPEGNVPNDFSDANCFAPTGGVSLALYAASTQTRYDMSDATLTGGAVTWSDLPLDAYTIVVETLPGDWTTVLWPDGGTTLVGSGETFTLDQQSGVELVLTLYAFLD